ncbi:MAG: RHS repeat protein [Alphaproteobacteria bacterium]|nr:RHS repeat protein [Alphaproteobacteria bacterium]
MSKVRYKARSHIATWFLFAGLSAAAAASLEISAAHATTTYVPSVKIGTAALITPLDAENKYNTLSQSSTDGLAGLNGGTPTPVAPEIVELTRALKSDPDLIYQYVHNNIQTTWMYGLQKGALGTEIDKAGTPFDQAELMVALLRQAGYTPSYVAGTIYLTSTQFYNWTGISDALAACEMLSSGGIPAQVNDNASSTKCTDAFTQGTAITHVRMAHIWVQVTISGSHSLGCSAQDVCVFDPSYKVYTWKSGINLATATGFAPGAALLAVTSGMQSGNRTSGGANVPYVNTLNAGQLDSTLQTYAINLLSYIQTNHLQGAQIEDIVSGGVIVPVNTSARQTTLPYADPSPPYTAHVWTPSTRYNAIPDPYRVTLEVTGKSDQYPSGFAVDTTMFDATFYADEIYGRQLTIDTDFRRGGVVIQHDYLHYYAQLMLDNAGFVALPAYTYSLPSSYGDTTARGVPTHVILTVSHPYVASADGTPTTLMDYMDALIDKPIVLITPVAIVQGWGEASPAMLAKWSDEAASDSSLPPEFTQPLCPNGVDPCPNLYQQPTGNLERQKTAASWLAQLSRSAKLNAAVANSVTALHHVLGFVYGDNLPVIPTYNRGVVDYHPDFVESDNFNRVDVDAGVSVTSKVANATTRRAAVYSIAATSATIEGSMGSQQADAPDTSSTATRFEWNNTPPSDHSPFGQNPAGLGPQDFLQFNSSTIAGAPGLLQVEGQTSTTNDGISNAGDPPEIGMSEFNAWLSTFTTEITNYVNNGFTVYAGREGFLGPGQRAGIYTPDSKHSTYTHFPTKQRGAAFVAVKLDANGDPTDIAHIVMSLNTAFDGTMVATKGGGGGDQPDKSTTYNPAQAADILKSRFVDRSHALGVNLSNGSLAYSSPVSLRVGNGGFPYELTSSSAWHAGVPPTSQFAPPPPTQPTAGWAHNWLSKLALSGSGIEALGQSDIRAATGAIVTFLVTQDIYAGSISPQQQVAAVLTQSWWSHQLTDNVVTVSIGASTTQFVQVPDGSWVAPGSGFATLTQNGTRVPFEYICGLYAAPYAMSRGWDDTNVSFYVTNVHGDVQHFGYWVNDYPITDASNCGQAKGFRLTQWAFLQGMSVTPVYANSGPHTLDALIEVDNSIGRKLTFSGNTVTNGLSNLDSRSITLGTTSQVDPMQRTTSLAFVGPYTTSSTQRPVPYTLLSTVTTPEHPSQPNIQYFYDTLGRVNQIKDAVAIQQGGRNPFNFYIADGTRGERDDPLSQPYTVVYDVYGHPSRFIDEVGAETDALFDSRGRVLSYIYPEGDCEAFAYDNQNNTTDFWKVDTTSSCNTAASSTHVLHMSASWDQTWNKPLTITNARNFTTTLTYYTSGSGASLMHTAARPTITEGTPVYIFSYDATGKPIDVTGPTGIVRHNIYDSAENLSSSILDYGTGRLNLTTSYNYDPQGDTVSIADPRGFVTTSIFDNDRKKTEDDHHNGDANASLNAATQSAFDEIGRITDTKIGTSFSGTTVTAWQTMKHITYTPTSKLATVTDADSRTTSTFYDNADRAQTVSDPLGRNVHYVYCAPGNTNCAANAVKTEYRGWVSGSACSSVGTDQECYRRLTYFLDGEEKTVKDANGNTTTYAYDGFIRLKKTTFSDNSSEQVPVSGGYDASGNVLKWINRNGQTLTYAYNSLDWITQKCVPSAGQTICSPPTNPGVTTSWTYLLDGRIDVLSDSNGTGNVIDYGYDTAGRMTSVVTTIPGLTGTKSVSYGLDANGNRTELVWPDGYYVGYCYDSLNRMTAAMENSTDSGCATNLLATYQYNALSRRTNITYSGSGAQVQTPDPSSYTAAGDLLNMAHIFPGGTSNNNTFAYTYTSAHQTNSMSASNSAWLWQPPGNNSTSYTVNNLNQYPTVGSQTTGGTNCQGNSQGLSYDCDGNLTFDGTHTFTYDGENRLLTASATGIAASYSYDPLGRRTKKSGSGVTTTIYLSDGTDEIAEYPASGPISARYIPGPASDELIAMIIVTTGAKEFFHVDKQGSVFAMSDSNGNMMEGPYSYDPYGNCFSVGDTCTGSGEPYRFTGRRWDSEIGCYYYRARYYCPDDNRGGRFLQVDPVGYKADLDLYTYVANDPTNQTDPRGLDRLTTNGGITSDCGNADACHSYGGAVLIGGDLLAKAHAAIAAGVVVAFTSGDRVNYSGGEIPEKDRRQTYNSALNELKKKGWLKEGIPGLFGEVIRYSPQYATWQFTFQNGKAERVGEPQFFDTLQQALDWRRQNYGTAVAGLTYDGIFWKYSIIYAFAAYPTSHETADQNMTHTIKHEKGHQECGVSESSAEYYAAHRSCP